ncbi:3-phosphoserine/phosphohydroxythreonine transaminase [Paucilactobacillus kaifaensis]|uniref:3-phosphoserine/phosphohydroxythreonine transaminase n=1 Tax=Paucilactobacillus kaifaensis TaxID=2559921 RepID=UPI0010F91A13|nr:3-phosphoserine/phosphohydroxythreonine transaminase [Paucilactobacillus kaifaensis]
MTVYNFSAGPGVLPAAVLDQIQTELKSFNSSQMSILEISHRSQQYIEMQQAAEDSLRDLMQIDDRYAVLFLHGGATLQFTSVPLNMTDHHHHVAYINSGHWAQKAMDAANKINGLAVDEVSKMTSQLPEIRPLNDMPLDYIHLTTNNTIEGTAYHQVPVNIGPLVADMSSNILAEPYDINQFDLVYAGAQKNIGPAGMAVVIVKRNRLTNHPKISDVMNYWLEDQKHSELNTPPVFSIYAAGLVFKWLKEFGGVPAIYQQNLAQANLLYDFIDNSTIFNNSVNVAERSLTNIVFSTGNDQLDHQFSSEANEQGLIGLAGHRLVGGMRASLYNAMPNAGVQALIKFMQQFELNHGGL